MQAEDDPVDPVENSLVYYAALRKAGVPEELHVFVNGGHAFGLRRWVMPCLLGVVPLRRAGDEHP